MRQKTSTNEPEKIRPSAWEKAHSLLRFNTCLFNYNLVNFLSPSALSSPAAYQNKNTRLGALAFFTATSFGAQFSMRQFFISILPLSYWCVFDCASLNSGCTAMDITKSRTSSRIYLRTFCITKAYPRGSSYLQFGLQKLITFWLNDFCKLEPTFCNFGRFCSNFHHLCTQKSQPKQNVKNVLAAYSKIAYTPCSTR